MTNNELSRKVLEALVGKDGRIRFKELVIKTGADARTLFKNLFFMEEKGYVQLSTSYPSDAVYPDIHLVRIRQKGEDTVKDQALLDSTFPLSDTTTDASPQIPPDLNQAAQLTYFKVLEILAANVRKNMEGEERAAALEKIESLLRLSFINDPVKEPDK